MVNRFKLLLLLVILAVLGILFIQNQQSLSLKLLCPDINNSCWYQTPQLPLSVWMGLFILAGIVTSLLWQILNRFSYSSTKKRSYSSDVLYDNGADILNKTSKTNSRYNPADEATRSSVSDTSDWENSRKSEDWQPQQTQKSTVENSDLKSQSSSSSGYEIRREPKNVTVSGSTYSYKFKEASDKESNKPGTPNLNKEPNLDDDDEEWI